MGVSISCKKTGKSIDMGCGGFFNLRKKVAELAGGPFAEHYASLKTFGNEEYFEAFDRKTSEILEKKQADIKIVDFIRFFWTLRGGHFARFVPLYIFYHSISLSIVQYLFP